MIARPLALALLLATISPALAEEPRIADTVVAAGVPPAQRAADLAVVRAFYSFWNTGDQAMLDRAVAPTFTDHTLPPGRPQGPSGPAFASKTFRAAVPDLGLTIETLIVEGDYVTVHMVFAGHFTGTFGTVHGTGQPIRFIATDLLKITEGQVTDNWHIEDNLTLLQQMGVAKLAM
ncbi:MAG: ester cyclase [Caulobacteraceae bacterium]|nr:ester cyclase [Caulobacter sp.]